MMRLFRRLEEARRHHRGQGQRHEGRYRDGNRQRHCEFAEQASNDAAHQQERYQNRDQRDADRDDGEDDFARAPERRREGLLALFDIAGDVLQHHDSVVHYKAHSDGQGHQRQIVEAVADEPHQGAGPQQRERHRDAGYDRRP
jgi:hypothetical protein